MNNFRDLIQSQSSLVYLSHAPICDYDKTQKIHLTKEALKAYEAIKLEIIKFTNKYLMSDTGPIALHSDASDYGVVS